MATYLLPVRPGRLAHGAVVRREPRMDARQVRPAERFLLGARVRGVERAARKRVDGACGGVALRSDVVRPGRLQGLGAAATTRAVVGCVRRRAGRVRARGRR